MQTMQIKNKKYILKKTMQMRIYIKKKKTNDANEDGKNNTQVIDIWQLSLFFHSTNLFSSHSSSWNSGQLKQMQHKERTTILVSSWRENILKKKEMQMKMESNNTQVIDFCMFC